MNDFHHLYAAGFQRSGVKKNERIMPLSIMGPNYRVPETLYGTFLLETLWKSQHYGNERLKEGPKQFLHYAERRKLVGRPLKELLKHWRQFPQIFPDFYKKIITCLLNRCANISEIFHVYWIYTLIFLK